MERTIKFKAKRLDNSEWVEGDLLHRGNKTYIYCPHINDRGFLIENEQVDPSTVCQFTGLTDTNGVEIWGHDNIYIVLAYVLCGEVIYNNEFCCFMVKPDKESSKYYEQCITFSKIEEMSSYEEPADIKVLGNKFDRKEGEV